MTLSHLPEIVLTCRNGHPFTSKAKGGSTVRCKECRVPTRVPSARPKPAIIRKLYTCKSCGRSYHYAWPLCVTCWRATIPPEIRSAQDRARNHRRRAIKQKAEVAGPVPASVYAEVRASGPCSYCGDVATTVDHIRPLARGGHEATYNLTPACASCNYDKRTLLLTEWQADRVAHGVRACPKVAAEYRRQTRPVAV